MGQPFIPPLRRPLVIGAAIAAAAMPAGASQPSGWPSAAAVPAAAPAAMPAAPIDRADDGLFYVNAEINGIAVRFVVDTGASVVVLTPDDARRIGVAAGSRTADVRMRTASGSAAMRWTRLDKVRIGRREVRQIDAAIVTEGLPVSLLGQNALSQMGSVTFTGNRLHLD